MYLKNTRKLQCNTNATSKKHEMEEVKMLQAHNKTFIKNFVKTVPETLNDRNLIPRP